MKQYLIHLKSTESNGAVKHEKSINGKIWVALFPGLKTPVKENVVVMVSAYAIANTSALPELQ